MKKRRNKIIALLLASAMLTANIGIVSAFAAEEEKTEQGAQKDESEEKAEAEAGEKKEDGEKKIQTAAPTADVKEGTYAAAQKITLKSAAKDAVIYYTTDGKEPTEKSTRFDAKKPVQIEKTTTIKAIAVAKDTGKSKVVSFTYKIDENAKNADDKETPAAETAAPTETPEQTPSASPAADPTMIPEQAQTQSEQGEAQLLPASETEEKAGETPGAETTAIASGKMEQELENKISVGTSLETLNQTDGVKVTEGDFTVESIKWEAADSSTAIAAGGKYKITLGVKAKEGFHFDSKTVLTFNGMSGKPVTPTTENDLERTYEFEAAAPAEKPNMTPSAEVLGGFKDGKTQVELSYNAADRDQAELLQYCLGDAKWETYDPAKKIILLEDENGECVVNARVVLKNGIASEKATETYKVKVARPTADIPTGTYNKPQTVKLSTITENAKIYYTLGDSESDPDDKCSPYTDPIEVKETTKIKAIAYDKDGNASAVAVFDYVIEKETPTPTATPTPTPEAKQITNIKVLELDKPSRGAKPDRKASVSSDTHATIESVEWLKDNKGNDIEGVFKADTIYYAYVHLKAKDGYEFDTDTFISNSTTENAKVSNYSHNPGVKSASKSDVVVYVAWKTQAAVTASPTNNTITGLSASYTQGATVTFTMNGAGANNAKEEGNERYVPVKYKISSSEFKFEDNQNPTLAKSFRISTAGTYTLTVTFQKQVYDAESGKWKNVDGATDTKTATVKINASSTTNRTTTTTTKTASSTSSSSDSSTSSKSKNAKTGDETPVGAVATVFVLAGAAVVALVARKRKSQK